MAFSNHLFWAMQHKKKAFPPVAMNYMVLHRNNNKLTTKGYTGQYG